MSIILDEDDVEQTEQILRRVRCADVIMVCQEGQLRQVEEVLCCAEPEPYWPSPRKISQG